jgi:autotransporter-associated beta strand protein
MTIPSKTGLFIFASALGMMFGLRPALAGSATWFANPSTGNWNTSTNWTPETVPNGPLDTATFQNSTISAVSISANTEVNGLVFGAAVTTGYTITVSPSLTLTISGTGISNNSAVGQKFFTDVDGAGNRGIIQFRNSSTAGLGLFNSSRATIPEASGGLIIFYDTSTAANGTFVNEGANFAQTPAGAPGSGRIRFSDSSTAGDGTFFVEGGRERFAFGGYIQFVDNASVGNGSFTTDGGAVDSAFGAQTQFYGNSSAGNGSFTTNGGAANAADGGITEFAENATAGNGNFKTNSGLASGARGGKTEFRHSSSAGNGTFFTNGPPVSGALHAFTIFSYTSTAANARLIAVGGVGTDPRDGGSIRFYENSTGGTAQVRVLGNGNLDISGHTDPGLTIGSIDGDGNVFLGARNLTVGNNNLSTIFSGVIQDDGAYGGTGGSLTKIGTGTLTVSGNNIFTGPTTVDAGRLSVDGTIMSSVTVNNGGTLAGSGATGSLTLNNGGTAAPDDSQTLHINGNYVQNAGGVLKIEVAGADSNASGHLDITGSATVDGTLEVRFVNGFLPASGQVIEVLHAGGVLAGSFAQIIFPDLRAGFQFQAEVVSGSHKVTALNDGVAATGFLNISTRMRVGTGDNALIGGFIVTGSASKKVIVRAIGPSLMANGTPLPGRLSDPTLELRDSAGGVILSNNNWMESLQAQDIIDSGIPPSDELEAAIMARLAPGSYTAIMRGVNNTTGIGVVEVYDLAQEVSAKLANISTRGFVKTGDNVMIGGFIAGNHAMHVMVRALGPSLTEAGVPDALADPTLELHDAQGAVIAFNNDWQETNKSAIESTGIPPIDEKESAILATLAPGSYTTIVRGQNGATGVGLVEVYGLQ